MDLLSEEVENENDFARIRAYRRIRIVAEAMGPEATEAQLMPFIVGESLYCMSTRHAAVCVIIVCR
jgi:hypothetical protein